MVVNLFGLFLFKTTVSAIRSKVESTKKSWWSGSTGRVHEALSSNPSTTKKVKNKMKVQKVPR
jgi:hypothetical protein